MIVRFTRSYPHWKTENQRESESESESFSVEMVNLKKSNVDKAYRAYQYLIMISVDVSRFFPIF